MSGPNVSLPAISVRATTEPRSGTASASSSVSVQVTVSPTPIRLARQRYTPNRSGTATQLASALVTRVPAGADTSALGNSSHASMRAGPRFLMPTVAVTVSPTLPRISVPMAARSGLFTPVTSKTRWVKLSIADVSVCGATAFADAFCTRPRAAPVPALPCALIDAIIDAASSGVAHSAYVSNVDGAGASAVIPIGSADATAYRAPAARSWSKTQ